jgi:hypothetical protein
MEVTRSDGTKAVVISPHRVAIWVAVLVAGAPTIIPAAKALRLLDHLATRVGSRSRARALRVPLPCWFSSFRKRICALQRLNYRGLYLFV